MELPRNLVGRILVQAKDMEQKTASIVVLPDLAVAFFSPGPSVLSVVLFSWDSESGEIHANRAVRKRLEVKGAEEAWGPLEVLLNRALDRLFRARIRGYVTYSQALLNTTTLEELLANRLTAEWQRFVAEGRASFPVWSDRLMLNCQVQPAAETILTEALDWVLL